MQMCETRWLISKQFKPYPSSSNPNKLYRLYVWDDQNGKYPLCTCMPYLTGRKRKAVELGVPINRDVEYVCSHQREFWADVAAGVICDWKQDTTNDYRYDGHCPKCGGPIVDTEVANVQIPDDPEGKIADLKALLDEFRGLTTTITGDTDRGLTAPPAGADPAKMNAMLNSIKEA